MDYKYLNSSYKKDDLKLPESPLINKFLLENSYAEITKALDFFDSDDVLLYIHGFLGTGKRQYINYVSQFFNDDVIKLEYYCKASTVCDDILINFIDVIESGAQAKNVNTIAKITTLSVKLQNYISAIKKPFVIILHAFDFIEEANRGLVVDLLEKISEFPNVKIIASTRAMAPGMFGNIKVDKKIIMKSLSKKIFQEFLDSYQMQYSETVMEDFYKYTRGYYYYTALTLKIVQASKISLSEFLKKFAMSGMSYDEYLGMTYINMIPVTIRNFFWFLRTMRHGLTANALAVFELLDEFALEYLKNNLMIFQIGELIFVQDYFQQDIDVSIPPKTEIKLHKYIINIYEKQLKESLQLREIMLSRQALRAEIAYHNNCIYEIENGKNKEAKIVETVSTKGNTDNLPEVNTENQEKQSELQEFFNRAKRFIEQKKYTDAITIYQDILNNPEIDNQTLIEARTLLARLYKEMNDLSMSQYYYELIELMYKKNNEVINLNYLYYELSDLYFMLYKNDRAIETIKKVIYSVDTPQTLMVSACMRLGNIYSSLKNVDEAYSYYQKALESLDENTENEQKAELYFKFALANDDKKNERIAFEYYSKCITINQNNPYKALAYSNLASCYLDNENYSDAKDCFLKAYELEKTNNNYDGIYYNAFNLANIYTKEKNDKALDFLVDAKQSAEFINEDFALLEVTIALGDYYYNKVDKTSEALVEYLKARRMVQTLDDKDNLSIIENRIKDMKYRMKEEEFLDLERKYG